MADANASTSIQLSRLEHRCDATRTWNQDTEIDTDGMENSVHGRHMETTLTGTTVRDHIHKAVGDHLHTYLVAKEVEEAPKAKARDDDSTIRKVKVRRHMMIKKDVKVKVKVKKVKDAGGATQ